MLTQPDLERAFRDHILGADLPASLLDALTHGPVVPAAEVLAIHRNTYALGLAEALGALFPAVRAVVGEDCFAGLATAHARAHPPRTPVLSAHGDTFADFLAAHPAVAGLPYLADLARLDRAWTEAQHAADAPPLTTDDLCWALSAGPVPVLRPHPALRALRLDHGVRDLWHRARRPDDDADVPAVAPGPQYVLVVRPHLAVTVHAADAGTHALLNALAAGRALEPALHDARAADPAFTPEDTLGRLVALGAFDCIPQP